MIKKIEQQIKAYFGEDIPDERYNVYVNQELVSVIVGSYSCMIVVLNLDPAYHPITRVSTRMFKRADEYFSDSEMAMNFEEADRYDELVKKRVEAFLRSVDSRTLTED